MRKLFISLFVLVLTLAGVAQAKPVEELTALANYFPQDTPVFASIRTDDGFAETLNGVIAQIDRNTGGDLLPDDFIIPSIKDLISSFLYVDMSWIGETAAIGVIDIAEETAVIAFEIGDPTGIDAFIEDTFYGMADVTEGDGYTLYSNDYSGVLVLDDVVLFGNANLETFINPEATLADSDAFTAAFGLLPEDSYSIAMYVNITAMNNASMMDVSGMNEDMIDLINSMQSGGSAALGVTILEGRDLVIDMVTADQTTPFGLTLPTVNPINLDFAGNFPGNTQIYAQGTNLGGTTLYLFEALDMMGPILQDVITIAAEMDNADTFGLDVSTINFGGLTKNAITPIFAGFTGLNLEDDVLSWMTGDYAMGFGLIEVPDPIGFTLDGAFVVEATDADAASNVVSSLGHAAELYGLPGVIIEDNMIVLDELLPSILVQADLPAEVVYGSPALDMLIASNDAVFAIGSRPSVSFALEPGDFTLADNGAFQHASSLFLPDTQMIFYIGTEGFVQALPALETLGAAPYEIEQLQLMVSQVESLSFSSVMLDETSALARMTLTIPTGAE